MTDYVETDRTHNDDISGTTAIHEEAAAAATKIQAVQRGKHDRQMLAEQEEAAVKIQAVQRGKASRAGGGTSAVTEAASGEPASEPAPEDGGAVDEEAQAQVAQCRVDDNTGAFPYNR